MADTLSEWLERWGEPQSVYGRSPPLRNDRMPSGIKPLPPKEEAHAYRGPQSWSHPVEKTLADAMVGAIMTPYDVGRLGAEGALHLRDAAKGHGGVGDAGLSGLELGALLAGARFKGRAPTRTLEEYVDTLKKPRDGNKPLLDYDTYLTDPDRVVGGRSRQFESQEPTWKRTPAQEAKNLGHWKNMDNLRELRDEGFYIGPDGMPVNPWYWPAPLWKAFEAELGPELAHNRLSQFLNYNASTSMQTAVPRNVVEAWNVLWHDINGIPFNKLTTADLTGAAYNNKRDISAAIAEGKGISGEHAHKIRNYSLNLHGSGVGAPEYRTLPNGEVERIITPVTLDSIMAREMRLRNAEGKDKERFVGPTYRSGMEVIHKLGDEVGAGGADTQAAIWQRAQLAKHGLPSYTDSYARIFDDVINKVASARGDDPKRVLSNLIHGTGNRPPTYFAAAPLVPPAGIVLSGAYDRSEPADGM
jgi:hypothetical protein